MAAGRSVLQLLMAASFVGCGLAFRLHVSPLPAGMPRLGGARSRGVKRIHWKFTLPPTAALGGNGVSSTFGAATKATETEGRTQPFRNAALLSAEYPPEAWPRTWVPIASTFELELDRPSPVEFLGYKYVCWRDNDNVWHVFDDACTHRLAPLSEGRVDRATNTVECAYHGWAFDGEGTCKRIPQLREDLSARACSNALAKVASYETRVHAGVLFVWPWSEDRLIVLEDELAQPEGMLRGIKGAPATYTRDLPYGWDMLLENLADPAHIPFAHHGLQGTRADAIPVNMTVPEHVAGRVISGEHSAALEVPALRGFKVEWGDRTYKKLRSGVEEYRAPFVISYKATFQGGNPWSLCVLCVPTRPGWSRLILFQGNDLGVSHGRGTLDPAADATEGATDATDATDGQTIEEDRNKDAKPKKAPTLIGRVFKLLPMWVTHLLSNRFLDSDLAFLHYQEHELARRGAPCGNQDALKLYYMPAQPDRAPAALRTWIGRFAKLPRPLPPAMANRAELFDRYHQHTWHCRHCRKALEDIGKLRTNLYRVLALSVLLVVKLPVVAAVAAVVVLGVLRLLAAVEPAFKRGDFEHWKND